MQAHVRSIVFHPQACQEAYQKLQDEKDTYLGAVFDWT